MTREEFVGLCERYNTVKKLRDRVTDVKQTVEGLEHAIAWNSADISLEITQYGQKYRLELDHKLGYKDNSERFLRENMARGVVAALRCYLDACECILAESSFPGDNSA